MEYLKKELIGDLVEYIQTEQENIEKRIKNLNDEIEYSDDIDYISEKNLDAVELRGFEEGMFFVLGRLMMMSRKNKYKVSLEEL